MAILRQSEAGDKKPRAEERHPVIQTVLVLYESFRVRQEAAEAEDVNACLPG